jgi:hypothetical protein
MKNMIVCVSKPQARRLVIAAVLALFLAVTAGAWTGPPPVLAGSVTNKVFILKSSAPAGSVHYVDVSSNLVTWTTIGTNTVLSGGILYTNTNSTPSNWRFFRTRSVSP